MRAARRTTTLRSRVITLPIGLGKEVSGRTAAHGCLPGGGSWLDHMGSLKTSNCTEIFISEPYQLTGDKVRAALEFADSVDAFVHVSPVSSWYPGFSVRLEFWPSSENVHLTDSEPRPR